MATGVLIMGIEGTGKSTSIRTLDSNKTIILQPNTKNMPFFGGDNKYKWGQNRHMIDTPQGLIQALDQINGLKDIDNIVIEDISHIMAARTMSSAFINDKGFEKWAVFGKDIYQSLVEAIKKLRGELFVWVIGHSAISESGEEGLRTSGKLLDQKIVLEGYFTYVFHSMRLASESESNYVFLTNYLARKRAKSPMGLYTKSYIPNDLQKIRDKILWYNTIENSEEVKDKTFEEIKEYSSMYDEKMYGEIINEINS